MNEEVRISDLDRAALELAKKEISLALANAKLAVAEQEKCSLAHKLVVMQIFMKYGLTPDDQITEDGVVVKNGKKDEQL